METLLKKYRPVTLESISRGCAVSLELECLISRQLIYKLPQKYNIPTDSIIEYTGQTELNPYNIIEKTLSHLGLQINISSENFSNTTSLAVEFKITFDINKPETLYNTVNILKQVFNFTVNDDCGAHIHIDTRSINREMAARRVGNFLPFIYSYIAKRRTVSRWSQESLASGSKGSGINLHLRYNTIEFRMLEGTTDITRIVKFAKLLYTLVHTPTLVSTYSIKNNMEVLINHLSAVGFCSLMREIRKTQLTQRLKGGGKQCLTEHF